LSSPCSIADTHHSLNVRSAVLHIVGDAASSVGVLAAGAIMAVTGWFWVDPAISLAITVAIAYQAGRVAWEAAHILMEGAPKGIDTPSVRDALLSLPHVRQVHDLHIWSLCSQCRYLSAHLVVSEEGLRGPDHPFATGTDFASATLRHPSRHLTTGSQRLRRPLPLRQSPSP
jgi:cation diffusion facilitator family transporter